MRKMNKKGFTLVELMVVLAILGLLAGIGIPQYTKVMERARIGRDVAAIATVQTVVTTFVSETDWLESHGAGAQLSDASENNKVSTSITAKSYLTGGTVSITAFFEDSYKLPTLESKLVSGGTWRIDTNGTVYVTKTEGSQTNRLPGTD